MTYLRSTLSSLLAIGALSSFGLARLQVIHNCADLAAATVDIYINDDLLPELDNVAFRSATPFLDAPSGVVFTVSICAPNSTGPSPALYTESFTLANNGKYIMVASGIVSTAGYSPNPGFSLEVFNAARETATVASNTDVLVLHGSTDAPEVDVYESAVLNTTAADDISFTDFAGYLELPTADYVFQIRTADNSAVVASFGGPLETLNLDGAAITVLASGFLDPAVNSNGEAFGLWVALAGGGDLVELPAAELGTARVQVVHNCADLAAASVDVWLNDDLLSALDDFDFRTATPFIDAGADAPLTISICPPNSNGPEDFLFQQTVELDENGSYIVVASGIVSTTGYTPNPGFSLEIFSAAREEADVATNTDILVMHGATDAPEVDVEELSSQMDIVENLVYQEFDGYLEVPTADLTLQVQTTNDVPVASFEAPLSALNLDGAAITVYASGFLDPSVNSNGPAFGLWVSLPNGGPLVQLDNVTGVVDNGAISAVTARPNPVSDRLFVNLSTDRRTLASLRLLDAMGRTVREGGELLLEQGERQAELDVAGLAAGTYQLSVVEQKAQRSIPVVVVR
jgi:Domain of unknown function (DUF4397)